MDMDKKVLIFGATGNIGGATALEMLQRGWQVRAVSRSPQGEKARALCQLGAEVIKADMDDRESVEAAFDGMKRVLSIQNWSTSGVDGEIRQGKLVAEAARAAGIEHLVYASAGTGQTGTGLPHFDSKLEVEACMRKLGLPFTIIRPGPFMELMTQKDFAPAMGTWGVEPKLIGWDTPKPWVAVRDIGLAAANVFSDPAAWVGREINLIGDVKSLAECRAVIADITGKKPLRIPLPVALVRKAAGNELVHMWMWIRTWVKEAGVDRIWKMVEASRALVPELLDVEGWIKLQVNGERSVPARNGSRAG
jgi:uncharacterized protein YbjT (DUF2867 family)